MSYRWQGSGIHGAGFQNAMAVDPRGNGVVLSGGDVAGIHRSSDWADSWETSNTGLYQQSHLKIATLLFSTINPDVVIGGVGNKNQTGGGLIVSLDNGRTWTLRSPDNPRFSGANNNGLGSLPSPHPRSTGTLLALDETDGWLYAASVDDGVMRAPFDATTGVGGTAWTVLGLDGKYCRALVRTDQNTLYAATWDDQVWRITGIQGDTPTPTKLASSPAKPEEFLVLGSWLYCVSSDTTDGGIWRMNLSTGTWTKINDANVGTSTSLWESLTGRIADNGTHQVYIGCASPENVGQYRPSIMRCADATAATPAWESITSDGNYVETTIAGPDGPAWWLSADQPTMMIGRGSYVAAQLAMSPDGTRLFSTGRSGMWRTTDPLATDPTWYPVVAGMAATICRDIACDPDVPGRVYIANTDWVFFTSTDHGQTVEQNKPNPNTGFALAVRPTDGHVLTATGDRDTATLGKVYGADAPADGTWTDESGGSTTIQGGDTFDRTTSAGDLGLTSDGARSYALQPAGNASALSCDGTQAICDTATLGAATIVARLGHYTSGDGQLDIIDPDVTWEFGRDGDTAGGTMAVAGVLRGQWDGEGPWPQGNNSYYEARIEQKTTSGLPFKLRVFRSDGGTLNQVGSDVDLATLGVVWDIGGTLMVRAAVTDPDGSTTRVAVKIWNGGDSPPEDWTNFDDTDANRIGGGSYGDGGIGIKWVCGSGYSASVELGCNQLDYVDLQQTTGGAGGLPTYRPFGLAAADVDGDEISIAAIENDGTNTGGLWRSENGTWTQIDDTLFTGQTTKSIPVCWPEQTGTNQIVFAYDRASGILLSGDSGLTWTRIWARPSNQEMSGYVAYHAPGDVLYVSAGGSLYRISAASTVGEDAAAPTNLGLANIGPICVDSDGRLYAARKVSSTQPAALLVSDNQGDTWIDVGDDRYRGQAILPFAITVGPDGDIYLALNGNGVIWGSPTGTTDPPPPPPSVTPPPAGSNPTVDPAATTHVTRLIACDLQTGWRREALTFHRATWTSALNEAGRLTATLTLPSSSALNVHTREVLDPDRTLIVVDRDGVAMAAGILEQVEIDPGDGQLTIHAAGLESAWDDTELDTDTAGGPSLTWTDIDQLTIVQQLAALAQQKSAAVTDLNILIGVETSGVARTVTYEAARREKIGRAIRDLAAAENGFDWAITPSWDGTRCVKQLQLWYPSRGRGTSLVFEAGTNMHPIAWQLNSRDRRSRITTLGKGAGDSTPSATATVTGDVAAAGYLWREESISLSDVTDPTLLAARAASALRARQTPLVTLDLRQIVGSPPDIGEIQLGDTVRVRVDDTFDTFDIAARIIRREVTVDADGTEHVDWQVAETARFG